MIQELALTDQGQGVVSLRKVCASPAPRLTRHKTRTMSFQALATQVIWRCHQHPRWVTGMHTVGGLLFEGEKTVLPGPKNLNPISSSKCIALAPHAKVLRTTVQY